MSEAVVKQPTLVLVGVNHNSAPIEVRERLSLAADQLADATRSLCAAPGVREGMILSTCNRVELLTVQEDRDNMSDLVGFLERYFAVSPDLIQPHLYELREAAAVHHLFRVASSLDSMVVGEPQILGQVKEAYAIARDVKTGSAGAGDPGANSLERLLQSAFSVAKKVRSETQIGSSSVSIASVAVDLARKIFGSLAGKHVLLVGAGKMAELAVRHLVQHGATNIYIANRTEARAQRMAELFAGSAVRTEVIPFERLFDQAQRADIVITSTGAQQQLFTRANGQQLLQRRRGRPMFFIDIAVPRDVDPRMNEVEGCFVYDIDDLQQVAAANMADRSREAAAAEAIVAAEVARYQQRLQALDAVPIIKMLQQHAEDLRRAELDRSARSLASLTEEQQASVEALTRSLTAKFLHPHLASIREAAEQGDAARLTELEQRYRQLRRR